MKRTTLIAAACALLVAATGIAAAAPGNAPVDAGANATAQDTNDRDARDESGAAEENGQGPAVDLPDQVPDGIADRVPENLADRGPTDLPAQVPDHVSEIHDRISSFLEGDLSGSLGDAVSEIAPGDQSDGGEAGDENTAQSSADGDSESDGTAESTETDGRTA